MEETDKIQLTSAELGYLWTTYQADSMSICMFTYFLEYVEDQEIKGILEYALDLSKQHIEFIRGIFTVEGIQIPHAFSEKDLNIKAGRLFSDVFYLHYVKNMAKSGLTIYGKVLPVIYRLDIVSFFSKCLTSTLELSNKSLRLLLEKGMAVRPPYIPYPKQIEFIQKQSFFLEGLGSGRPLTGLEIAILYENIQTNQLGSGIATAFSQVVESKKVRDYILRGRDIAIKHVNVFSDYLKSNFLPIPMSIDQGVTDLKEPPFSDKLMIFHFNLMNINGIGNYGSAISESQRSDLVVDFSRLLTEIVKYSEDGVNIMIENQWLEKPPAATDRKELEEG